MSLPDKKEIQQFAKKGARLVAVVGLVFGTGCEAIGNRMAVTAPTPTPRTSYDPEKQMFRYNSTEIDRIGSSDLFIISKNERIPQATYQYREALETLDELGCVLIDSKPNGQSETNIIQFKDPNCGPFKKP